MTDPFEYDVFISFSSADEEIVKPIWQELCSNGLRVFWSDSTLKKEVGNSWFEVIEKSLERSRHMILICSDHSMNSKWVQREYRAFFDYCYSANSRRLIPLLTREFQPNNLPLFLRQLQVGKINDPGFIQEIIPILGGVNIEKLQHELQSLKEQVTLLSIENESLREKSKARVKKVSAPTQENTVEKNEVAKLSKENTALREQLHKLTNEHNVLKETLHERESSLRNENASLKKKITALNDQNNLLNERLKERERSLSIAIAEMKGSAIHPANHADKVLPRESSLSRFIQLANQQTLDKSAEEYLQRGSEFLKKYEFDAAIVEFVMVFRKSSPEEETYQSAKDQLRSMGFSDEDMELG